MNHVKNRLTIGHVMDRSISEAKSMNDRRELETLRDFCRETASRIDGIISGIPEPKVKKDLYW